MRELTRRACRPTDGQSFGLRAHGISFFESRRLTCVLRKACCANESTRCIAAHFSKVSWEIWCVSVPPFKVFACLHTRMSSVRTVAPSITLYGSNGQTSSKHERARRSTYHDRVLFLHGYHLRMYLVVGPTGRRGQTSNGARKPAV